MDELQNRDELQDGAGEPDAGERRASHLPPVWGAGEHCGGLPTAQPLASPQTLVSGGTAVRMSSLVGLFAFLLMLSFFLPYAVEKMSYALARGRQRAEYETAGEQLQTQPLRALSDAYQMVAQRVGPSVVHINVLSTRARAASSAMSAWGRRHPPTDQGSGVIIDKQGYILTNRHVIGDSQDIEVKLSDGRTVPAAVVGLDRDTDLAVLKIDEPDLMPADWGDSRELQVGALVWALGSPFGLERSVTFGILSAKHRSGILSAQSSGDGAAVNYQDFLQTDAAVNPGNSGGPLVDSQGRVVGINTAIAGEWYQGISFAIPSSLARPIYERLRQDGQVRRGWLGVEPADVAGEDVTQFGLASRSGAVVRRVVDTSPAGRAGLKVGDVIVTWDGQPVADRSDLFRKVALTPIGTTVPVEIMRERQLQTLQVQVGDRGLDGPVQ